MQQDHTLAPANLTTATQADRTLVALLMKTISELSGQVALLTAKLATAQAENALIKKLGQKSTIAGHGHWVSSNMTRRILTQVKIETYILEVDRGSILIGTYPHTDTKWRSPTSRRHVVFQAMDTTSQLRD